MLHLILSALTPILFVVGLGWLGGITGLMPEKSSLVLARFVIEFALPIGLFLAAAQANPAELFRPEFLLALAAGLVGMFIVGYLASRVLFKHSRPEAALQGLGCSFPNMAYCGPPVLIAAVGSSGLLAVVTGNLFVTLITVPVTLVMIAPVGEDGSRAKIGSAFLHTIQQPLVFLPLAGAIVAVLGIPLPKLVIDATDEIGRSAAGTALFTLGLILSHTPFTLDREVVFNVTMKNIVQPAVILAVGLAVGLSGPPLIMAFLTGVLPSATEVPTLSIARKVYTDKAAATTMVSTLFAIVSITVGMIVSVHLKHR